MKQQLLTSFVAISLVASPAVLAANIKIIGTIPLTIQTQTANLRAANVTSVPAGKKVKLEKIQLSTAAKNYIANAANQPATRSLSAVQDAGLPPSIQLAMNGVPVLDQGMHGTCATFASTAAIDAAYGKTSYVSQLCNLTLGSYLEKEAAKAGQEYPSGWDGSFNNIVLGQIEKYGIITMAYQQQYGCGSTKVLKEYPGDNESNTGSPMSDIEFTKHSQYILKDIHYKILLNDEDALTSKANMPAVLNNVKKALNNGHRVVIGFLLDVNGPLNMVNGAEGTYKNIKHVAWIVTSQIRKDSAAQTINAGHAVIITGYDDNAVITGADGSEHRGVFTIRNSWAETGDHGDYYMSYDYFKLLTMEVEEISQTPLN